MSSGTDSRTTARPIHAHIRDEFRPGRCGHHGEVVGSYPDTLEYLGILEDMG